MNGLQANLDLAIAFVWTIGMCVITYRIKALDKKMDKYFGYDGEEYADKEEEVSDEKIKEYFSTLNSSLEEELYPKVKNLALIEIPTEIHREEVAL